MSVNHGESLMPGGTAGFLRGDWAVTRAISDYRTGQSGSFRGRASIRPSLAARPRHEGTAGQTASAGDDDALLEYREEGELRFGGHCGPATRSLLYQGRPDGSADVWFADGREFYRLDLQSGTAHAEHPCNADLYLGTVTALSADSFTEVWRVTGPAKDYELMTTYTRAARPG